MKSIEQSFDMQKSTMDQLELKIGQIKQSTSEFLPKSEFYAMTHNYVSDSNFKLFEESVEKNYLQKNRILGEFERLWLEVKSSKEYMKSNFLSAKE